MSLPEQPLPPPTNTDAELFAGVTTPVPSADTREKNKREDPPWGLLEVLLIAVVALISIFLFGIVAIGMALHGPVTKAGVADLALNPRVIIPARLVSYLLILGFMMAVVRSREPGFWAGIRWNWPGVTCIGYGALGIGLAIAVQSASVLLPIPKSLPIDRYFRDTLGAYLMASFGVSFAPLLEELFFRGFLYPVINRRWGVAAGVTITALLFALLHQGQLAHAWGPLLLIFLVGAVLTAVRAWTASVAASFITHVGYNATLFAMLFLASDHFRHLERIS